MKDIIYNLLLFPLPLLWLLLIILLFVKNEKKLIYTKFLLILFYISLTPIFSDLIEYPLTKKSVIKNNNINYSAILVPTGGIYKDINYDWHPSPASVLRAIQGENLAFRYNVPLIISGGKLELTGKSEAETVVKLLKYKNIIMDTYSRNSYETSIKLIKIYYENGIDINLPILLVTNKKHSLRMSLSLRKQGFKVIRYSNFNEYNFRIKSFFPDVRTVNQNNASLYEYIGIIYYFIKGYI